ncbi:MAG: hypothetical protein B7Z73_07050, partial [Planctomycetia bacterium 21-64-5]
RDLEARLRYAQAALAHVPRLLGAIDRNPFHASYGCFDRQFWHYRTASFPSEMYQEAVLPLALIYTTPLPGNRWQAEPQLKEWAIAALRFAARSSHADGSCDDYYPFERALGAAVFSLQAATRAYQLLELDDAEIVGWLERRAEWVANHDETGRLANHQALAALGLARLAEITGDRTFSAAADDRVNRLLSWQSSEGWFEEYGGADPGYQTVTIDALAKLRRMTGDERLDEPLHRAVAFARLFLHPDGSYGGEYGSRGTCHFYPHGFELLAGADPAAADLADAFLRSLAKGKTASFDDDRMYAHRLANLMEAYLDWSAERPAAQPVADCLVPRQLSIDGRRENIVGWNQRACERRPTESVVDGGPALASSLVPAYAQTESGQALPQPPLPPSQSFWRSTNQGAVSCFLPHAGMLVHRADKAYTIVSAARGGMFKRFAGSDPPFSDAGLIVETTDGRQAVSQSHDRSRDVQWNESGVLEVSGNLHWVRHETATPLKQAMFHLVMCLVGRWWRTPVRRLLQQRLITGRRVGPVRHTRRFEFDAAGDCRVTDRIELLDDSLRVRRMALASDLQAAYVAAANVYQEGVVQPWTDLSHCCDRLNRDRQAVVVRNLRGA